MTVPYTPINQNPRRNWTLVDVSPTFQKILGSQMVPSDSKHPTKKCNFCRREVQTYCKSTPGVHICSHCFADNIHEADNPL